MATVDKNFRVKNGLNVAGNATFESNVILGSTPLRFDTATNKLQIELNGTWTPIAFNSDIADTSEDVTFMDIGLAIDYTGDPIYTVQANGVSTEADIKTMNGGSPTTTIFAMVFDSGSIA